MGFAGFLPTSCFVILVFACMICGKHFYHVKGFTKISAPWCILSTVLVNISLPLWCLCLNRNLCKNEVSANVFTTLVFGKLYAQYPSLFWGLHYIIKLNLHCSFGSSVFII
jgi:hypothetical protein